jgi:hypothetical protein
MRPKRLPPAHHALAALAKRQHGVVSIRQLTGPLGYSRRSVSRAVAAGRLHRLHQGVFAVGHTAISRDGRCLAAVLACGPGSLLSHYSAAWLWGLSASGPAPYEVTTPVPRHGKPPLRVHHSRVLAGADRALQREIPVTAVPRTLLDLAARVRPSRLPRYLERAEELQLLDLAPIDDLLSRAGGHPGRGKLQRALVSYRPPPFTRSEFERRFYAAVLAAGLPRPAVNFNVAGFELDLYWPEQRFAVELDVFETHGTREAFQRDRERQEDLLLEGIGMTRVTDKRFDREPEVVIARIARLLEGRRPPKSDTPIDRPIPTRSAPTHPDD